MIPTDNVIQCSQGQNSLCLIRPHKSATGPYAVVVAFFVCGPSHRPWGDVVGLRLCFGVFLDCSSVRTTRLDSTQQGKSSEYHPQKSFDEISTEDAAGAQPSLCDSQGSSMRRNSEVPRCFVLREHREGSKELVRQTLGQMECCHPILDTETCGKSAPELDLRSLCCFVPPVTVFFSLFDLSIKFACNSLLVIIKRRGGILRVRLLLFFCAFSSRLC